MERTVISLQPDELISRSDLLRSHRGDVITVRFVRPEDAAALQAYIRSLSQRSRYNRFLGAISELPKNVIEDFVSNGRANRFSLVATVLADGFEVIVGEARYALSADTGGCEFGLSLGDRWQGLGLGAALVENLECRAAALGAVTMFGDTLRANGPMIALAGKSAFVLRQHPDDWKLVRFEKQVLHDPAALPCAGARGVAVASSAAPASFS
jgi:GNAT superfamily N-acetyltransferase